MTSKDDNQPPEPANAGKKQAKKNPGQFKPGQSGNPKGKPKGSRHKASLLAEQLHDGEVESITRKAIDSPRR